jgi:nucleoside 2-deoxyribosyltransferase
MKVYVASSWRNEHQPGVVKLLREDGHEVYDFKDSQGFNWSEVDPEWKSWTPQAYLEGLKHPCAERGFNRDMTALRECDACVYVMPCGPSASMEMGWAVAAGKHVIVYVPELRDPDLMVKMTPHITTELDYVRQHLQNIAQSGDRRATKNG